MSLLDLGLLFETELQEQIKKYNLLKRDGKFLDFSRFTTNCKDCNSVIQLKDAVNFSDLVKTKETKKNSFVFRVKLLKEDIDFLNEADSKTRNQLIKKTVSQVIRNVDKYIENHQFFYGAFGTIEWGTFKRAQRDDYFFDVYDWDKTTKNYKKTENKEIRLEVMFNF